MFIGVMAPPPPTLPAGPPSTTGFSLAAALRVSSPSWDPIPGEILAAEWS